MQQYVVHVLITLVQMCMHTCTASCIGEDCQCTPHVNSKCSSLSTGALTFGGDHIGELQGGTHLRHPQQCHSLSVMQGPWCVQS